MKRKPIGEVLREMGAIDEFQLRSALAHQRQWGTALGQVLVEKRFCTAADLLTALSRQTGHPEIDLDRERLDRRVAHLLPRKVAQQHRAVPLRVEGPREDVLVVALAAPATISSTDAILAVSGRRRIRAFVACDRALERAFGRIYLGYDHAETEAVEGRGGAAPAEEREFDFAMGPRPVLLYGWKAGVGDALARVLAENGIVGRVCGPDDVYRSGPEDVIVAPLPALEILFEGRRRPAGRLLVAGNSPESDLARAQAMRAVGFLAAPLDAQLFVRAVRRCQSLGPAQTSAA